MQARGLCLMEGEWYEIVHRPLSVDGRVGLIR